MMRWSLILLSLPIPRYRPQYLHPHPRRHQRRMFPQRLLPQRLHHHPRPHLHLHLHLMLLHPCLRPLQGSLRLEPPVLIVLFLVSCTRRRDLGSLSPTLPTVVTQSTPTRPASSATLRGRSFTSILQVHQSTTRQQKKKKTPP